MAGHSKFKNIQHRKNAQDAKRAKLFTRLVREVVTAAKFGSDPSANSRLRAAILSARAANVPKTNIDSAINKASDPSTASYEEVVYEGYLSGGIAVMVETLTDNRNRTASHVRSTFTKVGGNLGETGSVNYMFSNVGSIYYPKESVDIKYDDEKMLEFAIDVGANDCIADEYGYEFVCDLGLLHVISLKLNEILGNAEHVKSVWKAMDSTTITDEEVIAKINKFIDLLDESDDVQDVYMNCVMDE